MRAVRPARPCPACGGTGVANVVHTLALRPPDGHPLQSGYSIVVCASCGCGFADATPASEWYASYYGDGGAAKYATEDTSDTARFNAKASASLIAGLVPIGRVLDIGAGAGLLVEELRALGYQAEADEGAGRFAVVAATGVLEHVWQTDTFMQGVLDRLGMHGHFYVEVPDADNFTSPYLGPTEVSTEHVTFWTAESLSCLMRRHGLYGTVQHDVIDIAPGHPSAILRGSFRRGLPLAEYAERKRRTMLDIANRLEGALSGHRKYAIWGAGELSFQLLALAPLVNRQLVAIVDSNPSRHSLSFGGVCVRPPAVLVNTDGPIIVASLVQPETIVRAALDLGVADRLVILEAA